MARSTRPSFRLAAVAVAACAALAVAVPVGPGVGAAPADIAIPLDSGRLTVNGFAMNWPSPSVTGAELVGTWDPGTGALDAVLNSAPVTLSYPQLTGGDGTVTMVAASFAGTVLPGEEGAVTGTVTVEVRSSGLVAAGLESASPAAPAESLCFSEGEISFTSTLVPVLGGFGLTLTAASFDFPLDSGYLPVPGSSEGCEVGFTEAATGTPTSLTSLVITGFVATSAPEPPAPTPAPAVPAFTG